MRIRVKSAGLEDLLSFGGIDVSRALGLLYGLPAYDWAKMSQVYSLVFGLTDLSLN